jgi:hypothetical protein
LLSSSQQETAADKGQWVRIMPDLPSSVNHPRQRRNARRRAGTGASASKKSAPAQASDDQDQAQIAPSPAPVEAAALNKRERHQAAQSSDEVVAPPEAPVPGSKGRGIAALWRRLTPLSQQILLWGAISGAALFAFSTGLELALGQITNQTLYSTTVCLGDILTLGLLFFGGMRATARQGLPRHGGLAGIWGSVVAILLGLILSAVLVYVFRVNQEQASASSQPTAGEIIVNELFYALFNIALGFGAGWIGGRYSEWKRNKAKQQQEATVAP